MAKFKNKYRIESNRWKYWDYSSPGRYFLTVCIQNRECILGNVINAEMRLSSSGRIVKSEIEKIPTYHKRIILDEWVIMLNHIHIIIELADYDFDNGMCNVANDSTNDVLKGNADGGTIGGDTDDVEKIHEFSLRRKIIIPKIMGKLKMITSKHINIANNTPGKKNWQKDYHDHVIRDDTAHHNIAKYIIDNPRKWTEDTFHQAK